MDSNGLFLVMEHVSGFDRAEMLKQQGAPFPVADVVGWGLQLLDVVHYLHGYVPPILHRDIKPSNIKLTSSGHIMLLDFGLAKGAMGESTSIVTTRSVLGFTLSYSPLEQILRADPALMEHLSVLNAEEVQRRVRSSVDMSIASPTPSASTRPTPFPTRTPVPSPTMQPSPTVTSTPLQVEEPNIFKAQPDQTRNPSNVFQSSGRKITGMLDLSGTYKFDRLIAVQSDTPFEAGDYTSRKEGNNFYVVIRNASLQGNFRLAAGGAIDGADLQQRQGDVVLTVRMKDGVKTWVWRNNGILVQIGLKK